MASNIKKLDLFKSQFQEERNESQADHQAWEGNDYVLQRDYAATTRLNAQFWLWKHELGFNIHPSIPRPSSSACIADVATGTGIWMLDASRELPDRQFYGFDISLQQCPPADWLPPSIQLQQWDIYGPLPPGFEGMFEVVHIRLLALVIRENNPSPLLQSVKQILKPGGYLQWDELDVWSAYVTSKDPSVDLQSYQMSNERAKANKLQWTRNLKQIIADNGFEAVEETHYEPDLALAKFYQDAYMMMTEEMVTSTKSETERKKILDAMGDVHKQAEKGVARCVPKKVFIARKPHD